MNKFLQPNTQWLLCLQQWLQHFLACIWTCFDIKMQGLQWVEHFHSCNSYVLLQNMQWQQGLEHLFSCKWSVMLQNMQWQQCLQHIWSSICFVMLPQKCRGTSGCSASSLAFAVSCCKTCSANSVFGKSTSTIRHADKQPTYKFVRRSLQLTQI